MVDAARVLFSPGPANIDHPINHNGIFYIRMNLLIIDNSMRLWRVQDQATRT
jgi:hypothetical protein